VDPFFADLGVDVSYDFFEDVWPQADAFVFSSFATTAFGVAVCTNRPICVLALDTVPWFPESLRLLKDRCEVVPFSLSESKRPQFDVERIIGALSGKQSAPGMGYVVEQMLPRTFPET